VVLSVELWLCVSRRKLKPLSRVFPVSIAIGTRGDDDAAPANDDAVPADDDAAPVADDDGNIAPTDDTMPMAIGHAFSQGRSFLRQVLAAPGA
jgi:hypothetical protein